jgi:hypothetical protein
MTQKPMMELRPCPFCDASAAEWEWNIDPDGKMDEVWIECDACCARGPTESTLEKAADSWNYGSLSPADRGGE